MALHTYMYTDGDAISYDLRHMWTTVRECVINFAFELRGFYEIVVRISDALCTCFTLNGLFALFF